MKGDLLAYLLTVDSPADLLSLLKLPPRGPKGGRKNADRAVRVGCALHVWKVARFSQRGRARHENLCGFCCVPLRWFRME